MTQPSNEIDVTLARTKWDIRRSLQAIQGQGIKQCFQAWKLSHQHHLWHARHAEAIKQRREERLHFLLESAEAAARVHDMSKLYQIINKLTPKTKPSRIQLRSDAGHLLGPTEAFQVLCNFVSETWHGTPLEPALAPAPGVPFSESDLESATRRIQGMKSMAPHTSPGFSLLGMASTIATKLMPLLHQWWNASPPSYPNNGGMVGCSCCRSRPRSRTNRGTSVPWRFKLGWGKLSSVLFVRRHVLRPCRNWWFSPSLHMQGRGCEDAIVRALMHCNRVISQKRQYSMRPSPPKIYGGVTLSIDLQRAFDTVPRMELFSSLEDLGVDQPHQTLLRAWHEGTCYHVTHKFQTASIPILT